MHDDRSSSAPRTGRRRRTLATTALTGALLTGLAVPANAAEPSDAAGGASPARHNALKDALDQDLRQYLAAEGPAEHFSAVSLTVSYPGRPGISLAEGTTQYGGSTPVSPDAMWQIGSNTKAFTSVLLLQLEAEGRLSIDDALGRWLPQYPAWRGVTLRKLLNMTSGIPDYIGQKGFQTAVEADPGTAFTVPQLVAYAYGAPATTGYSYSNTNYLLAQMVVEKVTGDTYSHQLTRRILHPLGLRHTCDAPSTCRASDASRIPSGYYFSDPSSPLAGAEVPKLALTWAQGAGGIVSSLQDMTTWDRALYQGRLLPPRQQRELESLVSTKTGLPIRRTTPDDPEGFGLGVAQVTSALTGTAWFYEGETFGYRVLHLYVPATGTLIAVATNSSVSESSDSLSALMADVYETLQSNTATPLQQVRAGGGPMPAAPFGGRVTF